MLEIRYLPLADLVSWDKNPKRHDTAALARSIARYGFRDAPILDQTLGAIVAGNGRAAVLVSMQERGLPAPDGIQVADDGTWMVPIQVGMDAASIAEAEAFALDHNNLTLLGGDLTLFETAALWDRDGYLGILSGLAITGRLPVSVDGDDLDALLFSDQPLPPIEGGDLSGPDTRPIVSVRIVGAHWIEAVAGSVRQLLAAHPEWETEIVLR